MTCALALPSKISASSSSTLCMVGEETARQSRRRKKKKYNRILLENKLTLLFVPEVQDKPKIPTMMRHFACVILLWSRMSTSSVALLSDSVGKAYLAPRTFLHKAFCAPPSFGKRCAHKESMKNMHLLDTRQDIRLCLVFQHSSCECEQTRDVLQIDPPSDRESVKRMVTRTHAHVAALRQ